MYRRMTENGAQVTVFTDSPEFAEGKPYALVLPKANWAAAPFAYAAASQLFACHLADLRGTNPDTSRNLNKYTITV
jgi:fructoselysine-6-P-deglycase FrlB-like protein